MQTQKKALSNQGQNEDILHELLAFPHADPEWPELPQFFTMRCGKALEEMDLGQCAQVGEKATCPECRSEKEEGTEEEKREACTTFW